MKTIIIRELESTGGEIITNIPDDMPASSVVDLWQKDSFSYKVRKKLPPCIWKVAESNNFVDAMLELAKL